MFLHQVDLLINPTTGNRLKLKEPVFENNRIKSGILYDELTNHEFPIINFIPRFVSIENYSSSFGFQWNIHHSTQYDTVLKFNVSKERFQKETKWEENLKGEYILEVGSGSGRFTVHALETGASVVSLDYSNAVEANYKSNGGNPNLLIVQASVYEMPFARNFFDKVFCFGVLQHTPDPKKSFFKLIDYLKSGGKLATDIYLKSIGRYIFSTKYWIRPFTRKRNPEKLYKIIIKYINISWPIARLIRKIPKIGPIINWRLLIADYSRELPNADDNTLKQLAYLDTMDMLSPRYDYPQTLSTFMKWHKEAGLSDIDMHYGYNGIESRATKL